MNYHYEHLIAAARRKDDLRFATKERLIQQAVREASSFSKRYRRWLARLGGQLVAWGSRLEARYAEPFVTNALSLECYKAPSGTSAASI